MLKLIKYELRKNRNALLILLAVAAALEAYFLVSMNMQKEAHMVTAVSLLTIAGFGIAIAVFAMGISSYSSELKQRSSYLIFMTPNTPLAIICSKMLFTLLLGVAYAAAFIGLMYVDVPLFLDYFGEWRGYNFLINQMMAEQGVQLSQFFMAVSFTLLAIVLEVLSIVGVAYLAVTISATVLNSKKVRGLVSFLIFAGISFALSRISGLYINDEKIFETMQDMMVALIPAAIQGAIVIAASIFGSAWLLEKHVSL